MLKRNIYRDDRGLFFKALGWKFYIDNDAGYREGGKICVQDIGHGRGCADHPGWGEATYLDSGGSLRTTRLGLMSFG